MNIDYEIEEKYYNLTDEQIDNLLYGVELKQQEVSQVNNKCISCKSEKLIINNTKGYLVCNDCGVINKEFLDKNQEFNNDITTNNNTSSRYGCPSNYFFPKSSLGTKISGRGYNRAALLQRQGQMPYREKSLLEVLEKIQEKCKKYNITQPIIDTAKILYKKVSDCKHTKGKRIGKNIIMRCVNRRSMIAACLFHACKLQNEPLTPKEIADIYDLNMKCVSQGYKKFSEYIDIPSLTNEDIKCSKPVDFIDRFAKKLNIEKKYIDIIKEVANNLDKLDMATTHEPPSVAAGCILLVANMFQIDINKQHISNIFGISDVTISKTYRKIQHYHKFIFKADVVNLMEKRLINNNKKMPFITAENLVITDNERNSSEVSTSNSSNESLNTSSEISIPQTIKNKKSLSIKDIENMVISDTSESLTTSTLELSDTSNELLNVKEVKIKRKYVKKVK